MSTNKWIPDTVKENVYSLDHPEVRKHTEMFIDKYLAADLFAAFDETRTVPAHQSAIILGAQWYRFSEFLPRFAAKAVWMLRDARMMHFVIQTPFEELGGRDGSRIHADLFLRAMEAVKIDEIASIGWGNLAATTQALEFLDGALDRITSDHEILGLLHGLEIPAEQIIDRLYDGLAHNQEARVALNATPFFLIHRQIEVEHIRRGTANFLRFSIDRRSKVEFMNGFANGLVFWKKFWDGIAEAIAKSTV